MSPRDKNSRAHKLPQRTDNAQTSIGPRLKRLPKRLGTKPAKLGGTRKVSNAVKRMY